MEENISQLTGNSFFPIPDFPLAVVSLRESREFCKKEGYTYLPHYHDYHELVFITSGSGVQNINGRNYPVYAGDVFLIFMGTTHYFHESHSLELHNLLFNLDNLSLPLRELRKIPGYQMIFRSEPKTRSPYNFRGHLRLKSNQIPEFERLLYCLKDALEKRDEFSEAEGISLFIRMILYLSKNYMDTGWDTDILSPKISVVIAQMEHEYSKPFRLDELAAGACTSPRNFSRLFQQITGHSPIEYLLKIRLRHAAEQLQTPKLSVGEIAERCGFHDSNYFTKRFTQEFGVSPRGYRKSLNR